MRILSLFDGISCARVALERAGIPVEVYYASEIEQKPIEISNNNYPDIIQLGDVCNITKEMVGEIDLICGGSPCQSFSNAGNRTGFDGKSGGFADDKKKKPNTAWAFLFGLSKSNGETVKLPKPIPDTIRQHKTSLAQKLKAIFKNETDPFYDSTETQTYRIKIQLIPPQIDEVNEDKYGTREYLKDTMTEEYE